MTTLVYVHGTNGSGKSTLARDIIRAAGGYIPRPEQENTITKHGVVLLGKYKVACGGLDTVHPYAKIHSLIDDAKGRGGNTFAEGLVTPGLFNCKVFASRYDRAVFIWLNTSPEQCIKNVLERRAAAGNTKPYDPTNLHKKARSAESWARRLEEASLEVYRLKYGPALRLSKELLGLR